MLFWAQIKSAFRLCFFAWLDREEGLDLWWMGLLRPTVGFLSRWGAGFDLVAAQVVHVLVFISFSPTYRACVGNSQALLPGRSRTWGAI